MSQEPEISLRETAYCQVPVAFAAEIASRCNKDIVIIFCLDHVHQHSHTTTFGRSAQDKLQAASMGEELAAFFCGELDPEKIVVYEDFRSMDAAKLKEENDQLKAEIAALKERTPA